MAKLLTIDDMLEVAQDLAITEYDVLVHAAEMTAKMIAEAIAAHMEVQVTDVSFQGKAFGGLNATFVPATPGQACPPHLHEHDESGEWDEEVPGESQRL